MTLEAGREAISSPPGRTDLFIPLMGGRTVPIAIDEALVASVDEHELSVEGGQGALVLVVDRYPSRTQAGEEVYVRILDLDASEERWSMLVASATAGTTPLTPLLTWVQQPLSVRIGLAERSSIEIAFGEHGALTVTPNAC